MKSYLKKHFFPIRKIIPGEKDMVVGRPHAAAEAITTASKLGSACLLGLL